MTQLKHVLILFLFEIYIDDDDDELFLWYG